MSKMVSGILARDKSHYEEKCVVFFETKWPPLELEYGVWVEHYFNAIESTWTPQEFMERYDLFDENGKPCKLPAKGKYFEVEIEL